MRHIEEKAAGQESGKTMNSGAEIFEDRLSDFTQDRRVVILSGLGMIIGAISAPVAAILVWLIAVITNLSFYGRFSPVFRSPDQNHLGFLVLLVPVAGGLIIGLMARFGSERIRGHGIPEALEAILFGQSRMAPKVAILKPVSSAISIGTGGPFGAEGPIIMTGGAVGSLCAQLFHLTAAERKTLLVAGAAAGMAAIFASPVAAVMLSVELLLFEWKPRSVIPVAMAAAVAFALRIPLLGPGPIFPVNPETMPIGGGLVCAFLVGIVAGLVSGILTGMVYRFEDMFGKSPIHWMWWPALGGLAIGIGGLIDPRILGVGYDTIHHLLKGEIVGAAILGILIGKAVVWSLALGSGTSGGVLAPLLMIGGALGAAEARIIPIGNPGLWALVSMAALMGGTMRAPLTAMVFAVELTRNFEIMPFLLVACIASYAVTVLLLRRSILTEKVARRGYHLTREYSVDPLAVTRVAEVMERNVYTVPASMTVAELAGKLARHDSDVFRHQGIPVVDGNGSLAGIITRGDMLHALKAADFATITVLEAGTQKLITARPDELVRDAVARMLRHDIGRLPVVDRADSHRLIGYLSRANILMARSRQLDEEHLRERGMKVR
jgi:chloride channel protein, CIC family